MSKLLSGFAGAVLGMLLLTGCGNRGGDVASEQDVMPEGNVLQGEQTIFLDGRYQPIVDENDIRAMLRSEGIDDPGEIDINREVSNVAEQMSAISLEIRQGKFELNLSAFGADQAYAGEVVVTDERVLLQGEEFAMEFDFDFETRTLTLVPSEEFADIPPMRLRRSDEAVS